MCLYKEGIFTKFITFIKTCGYLVSLKLKYVYPGSFKIDLQVESKWSVWVANNEENENLVSFY